MYDILTEQLKHYTVLWRETSALYEEWAKKHGLSYYELLVILSIMEPDGPRQSAERHLLPLAASKTDGQHHPEKLCRTRRYYTGACGGRRAGLGHSADCRGPVIYGSHGFRSSGP